MEKLNKSFDGVKVLDDIDLSVNKGEVVCLIGPSGSGKSTLLRSVNCLEIPESGTISFEDHSFDFEKLDKNDISHIREYSAMVFQNYNLFRNKTTLHNVSEYLTKVEKLGKKEAEEQAEYYLQLVGLADKINSYPHQLSGGQQQRVGIARALAMKPKIMLLDEPTSALDLELIKSVLTIIQDIAEQGQTMLIVTHEINFARQIADQVIFLEDGKILAKGSSKQVLENPSQKRIQEFLELINI